MPSQPTPRALLLLAASFALSTAIGCGRCQSYEPEEEITDMETAGELAPEMADEGTEELVTAAKVDDDILSFIDKALADIKADPTQLTVDAESELTDMIKALPETRDAAQLDAEYANLMARFDVVLMTAPNQETRKAMGNLKRAANRAFEAALAEEQVRGGDDALRATQEAEAAAAAAKAAEEAAAAAEAARAEAAAETSSGDAP